MTPARQQALVRGLTTVARKVFDATPINEPWSASQIDAELRRLGTPKSIHMVTGCLNGLVKDGLVTEGPLRMFQRIVPRSYEPPTPLDLNSILKHAAVPHKEPAVASTLPPKAAPVRHVSAIDRLSAFSDQARKMSAVLTAFADDLDEAALLIDEQVAGASKDTEKLRQLQALLRGE